MVYDTSTAPPDHGLITFTSSHSLIYTESDVLTTGQGTWEQTGRNHFVLEFQAFLFSPTGASNGWSIVRAVVEVKGNSFSGSFKFDIFNTAGHLVQSDSGTDTATRFVIRPL